MPALDTILARTPLVEHIVIETSGLALPKPLVQAFQWPAIKSRVTVDGVVAVVDGAALAEGRFAADPDALARQRDADAALDHDNPIDEVFDDQIACADLVVLNKLDLLDATGADKATAVVQRALPRAVKIVPVANGKVDAAALLGLGIGTENDIANRRTRHALLIVGLPPQGATPVADIAERLGFVVRASDPRRLVLACAGAPICAAAEIATRPLAQTLAMDIASLAAGAPVLHLSGCAKGCACARATPLTVVGTKARCGVVVNGSARDAPVAMLLPEALPSAFSRLAETVRRMRKANESTAQVLSRLEGEDIVGLMLGEASDG